MGHGVMEPPKARRAMGAPEDVITLARRVMGGIDLDPYSTEALAQHEGATAFYHRKAHRRPWHAPGTRKRALLSVATTTVGESRELLNRLMLAWDKGHINEALAWVQCNEALRAIPWLWDPPIILVIPFRRLRPLARDPKTDRIKGCQPSSWSFLAYFPPAEAALAQDRLKALVAEVKNLTMGRIVLPSQPNLSADWQITWKERYGEDFDFEPEEIDIDG